MPARAVGASTRHAFNTMDVTVRFLQSIKKHPDKLEAPTQADYEVFEEITNVCAVHIGYQVQQIVVVSFRVVEWTTMC